MKIIKDKKNIIVPDSIILATINGENKRILVFDMDSNHVEVESMGQQKIYDIELEILNLNEYEYMQSDKLEFEVESYENFKYRIHILSIGEKFSKNLEDVISMAKINKMVLKDFSNISDYQEYIVKQYDYKEDYFFHDSLGKQLEEWITLMNDICLQESNNFEWALQVDSPNKWHKFIDIGANAYIKNVIKHELYAQNISMNSFKRVYLGNEFCECLLPELSKIELLTKKCFEANLDITFCTTYMKERRKKIYFKMLQELEEIGKKNNKKIEVVFNDWGVLNCIKDKETFIPVLGRLLNIRKKDPRISHVWGYEKNESNMRKNSLNNEIYQDKLNMLGVTRFEMECAPNKIDMPKGKHSIHIPFYQMETSVACTMYALCKNYSRYKQEHVEKCPFYCQEFKLLFPKHLRMIGIGNSIFGFNKYCNNMINTNSYNVDRIVYSQIQEEV